MPRGSSCGALAKERKPRTDRMLKPSRDECAELYGRSGANGEVPGHPEISCLCTDLIPIRAHGRILLREVYLMLQVRLA